MIKAGPLRTEFVVKRVIFFRQCGLQANLWQALVLWGSGKHLVVLCQQAQVPQALVIGEVAAPLKMGQAGAADTAAEISKVIDIANALIIDRGIPAGQRCGLVLPVVVLAVQAIGLIIVGQVLDVDRPLAVRVEWK